MQIFYLIIGKDKLFLYEKDNGHAVKQYIEGNPYFLYDVNKAESDVQRMLDLLVNEYNLDTVAELEFIILENDDDIRTNKIEQILSDYIIEKLDLRKTLLKIMKTLNKDKKLYINDFGINYDGMSFYIKNNKLEKSEFNLLSYTLQEDTLMKYII